MNTSVINNVFSGKNALQDYLNPDNHRQIPLVELPEELNPYKHDKVRIFAKLMNTLPLGNIKSLPAYNMLNEEYKKGNLDQVHTLIENSSGNTVFSLAVLGRGFGIKKTRAIVSNEVSEGKLKLLRFFNTDITVNREPICPDPADRTSGIHKAKKIGQTAGFFNPGQYENYSNPAAHEKWTGPQIWNQTDGKISVFCAGLGTTGTMYGVGKYLKSMSDKVKTVAVTRAANNPVPGVRTENLLRQISFDWKKVIDYITEIGTIDSFKNSLALCRAGLVVGPSSGFALAGLLKYFHEVKHSGELESLKNENGEVIAVFICCDTPYPYIDEYFEYLEESLFPKIKNKHLLKDYSRSVISPVRQTPVTEVAVQEVNEQLGYKNTIILDVRNKDEYDQFHINNALHLDFYSAPELLKTMKEQWNGKKVYVVCNHGNRSKYITYLLNQLKIDSYSVRGGMIEWSKMGLPRWISPTCIL